jgi:hypothetical protein
MFTTDEVANISSFLSYDGREDFRRIIGKGECYMDIPSERTVEEKQAITQAIRQCYKEAVTEKKAGCAKLQDYDLYFMFAVDPKDGRFKASLFKLSDCALEIGNMILPDETVYTCTFDFVSGMKHSAAQGLITKQNEKAIQHIHEELHVIFEKVTAFLLEQMNKK